MILKSEDVTALREDLANTPDGEGWPGIQGNLRDALDTLAEESRLRRIAEEALWILSSRGCLLGEYASSEYCDDDNCAHCDVAFAYAIAEEVEVPNG